MVKSAAERQRLRRQRLANDREWRRLNLWIRIDAHRALARLAARDRVTVAEEIERLAITADTLALDAMQDDERNQYFRDCATYEGRIRRKKRDDDAPL